MAIARPKLDVKHAVAPAEGFDAMGIPILRSQPDDYPTLVPDNPWRAAREERHWVHIHWNPSVLAEMMNSAGQIMGQATYYSPYGRGDDERPWPGDVQYMGTWIDHKTEMIIQRYCHPDFSQVQEGEEIPVVRVWFPIASPDSVEE